uniref:Uncharacterized protein n=1 Tax=Anthurium amnicola TaxID=1678845 RepID=A0A1D1YE36_9ARAE
MVGLTDFGELLETLCDSSTPSRPNLRRLNPSLLLHPAKPKVLRHDIASPATPATVLLCHEGQSYFPAVLLQDEVASLSFLLEQLPLSLGHDVAMLLPRYSGCRSCLSSSASCCSGCRCSSSCRC